MHTRDLRYNVVVCACEPLRICCGCRKLEEDGRILGLTGCIAMFSRVGHGRTPTPLSYTACSEGPAKPQGHFRSLCLLAAMPGQPTLRATSRSHARKCTKQSLEACTTGVRSNPWSGCGSDPDVCGGAASRTCGSCFQGTWHGQGKPVQTIPCCSKHVQRLDLSVLRCC